MAFLVLIFLQPIFLKKSPFMALIVPCPLIFGKKSTFTALISQISNNLRLWLENPGSIFFLFWNPRLFLWESLHKFSSKIYVYGFDCPFNTYLKFYFYGSNSSLKNIYFFILNPRLLLWESLKKSTFFGSHEKFLGKIFFKNSFMAQIVLWQILFLNHRL